MCCQLALGRAAEAERSRAWAAGSMPGVDMGPCPSLGLQGALQKVALLLSSGPQQGGQMPCVVEVLRALKYYP